MEIKILTFNDNENILAVHPNSLKFENGQTTNEFFIISHYSNKSSNGKIVLGKSGEESDHYQFANNENVIEFKIIEGSSATPQNLKFQYQFSESKVIEFQDNSNVSLENKSVIDFPQEEVVDLIISLEYDSKVILNYAVYPRGTIDVSFIEIINKQFNCDDYADSIIFGTNIVTSDTNSIEFTV